LTFAGFALAVAALFTQGHIGAGEREDRGNRWVIAAFGFLGLLLGCVPAYTERMGILTVDGDAVRWIGVVLNALGGALRIYPVFVLGRRFSGLVAIQPGHTLVTDDIYGVLRHPSYLGLILNALGWVLVFRSGVGEVHCSAAIWIGTRIASPGNVPETSSVGSPSWWHRGTGATASEHHRFRDIPGPWKTGHGKLAMENWVV